MTLAVGVEVEIDCPKHLRWHEERGLIVAQHPPKGDAHSYVVRVNGLERIFPKEQLRTTTEAKATKAGRV